MLTPRKSLGQNFLTDANIARKIVDSLNLRADDVVVELGAGTGALTKHLAEKPARLVGIEIDARAADALRERLGASVELVRADVLSVSLSDFVPMSGKRLRVVGNIPYYITSDILFWLFDQREAVRDATLMMQLEVAQRLVARPRTKAYGILSVAAQYHSKPEQLFRVSRNSFSPRPTVDSAVVRLDFSAPLPESNRSFFTTIVRATFGKRRKTLRNGLRYLGFSGRTLAALPFNLDDRPEALTLEDFLNLTKLLEPFARELNLKPDQSYPTIH
jgi:16S rRNA (adenine1518-N6/adenine1519-N6)-dimethyltransferase